MKEATAKNDELGMTYPQLLHCVRSVGGYITDPIGKCLRTTSRRNPPWIERELLDSATFAAFQQGADLSALFEESRADPAFLIWIEVPETGEPSRPLSVLVDRVSGIIEETRPTGAKRYGYLADVEGCIHYIQNGNSQFGMSKRF